MMKKLIALASLLYSSLATADIFWFVRTGDGATNWQYVANFSSGIFIIALSFTALRLFLSRRQVRTYNNELEEIRTQLELRVKERTATLEDEITEHRETTIRLRHSESYITSILRSMPLMLIGLNKSNQITQWNQRAEEISGVSSSAVMGMDLWEAYPTITISPDQIQQAQDDNETLTIKYSQRGQYHFDITIYPLQDQLETGVVILIDDVTQRVHNETLLIQRDKMSSMGEMASIMAHDINIPLRAILKDVKTVRQGLTDEPIDGMGLSELLEDAVIRGQQATSIISNLVDYSGSGGGEKVMANMKDVVNHSVELANDVLSVMAGLRFRDVKVTSNYADDLPDVACYVTELQQVFLSLFRHSCYALGKVKDLDHSPEINIEVTKFYENLWVRIQHNGRGISLEDQKTIFEPFAADGDADGSYDAGKRLSFSHFIVEEQHQGQIAVTSDPEVGTTFHIQLPLA
ncbi:PAS domain-containing sensor histidine kinase [Porticoccaceae bacterium]|nr:PAS domain-containing sensor histidine kinase [Porticoccaceae bacterium]